MNTRLDIFSWEIDMKRKDNFRGKEKMVFSITIDINNDSLSSGHLEKCQGGSEVSRTSDRPPRGRSPVPEAAAKSAAEAAETSASSGSGWWAVFETGHPAAGDGTRIPASAVLVLGRGCGE